MAFNRFYLHCKRVEMGKHRIYASPKGHLFTCFQIDTIDEESSDFFDRVFSIQRIVSKTLPGNILRFYLTSRFEENSAGNTSRSEFLKDVGSLKFSAYLVVESSRFRGLDLRTAMSYFTKGSKRQYQEFSANIDDYTSLLEGLRFQEISYFKFQRDVFGEKLKSSYYIDKQCLDFTSEYWGVLRLNNFRKNEISINTLGQVKDQLDGPFVVSLSVLPYARQTSEFLLRAQIGKGSATGSLKDLNKLEEAESDLDQVVTQGERVCLMEFLVLLKRNNKEDLMKSLRDSEEVLSPLGQIEKETYGVRSSVNAMIPGEGMFNQLYEKESKIPFFVPLITRGSPKPKIIRHSLITHRRDDSLDSFSLFDHRYDNFSACIFGKSGKGKSALTNLLTRALHNDSSVRIIKVDVGGSHSRETKQLGGKEIKFSLDTPSGLNPFREAVGVRNKEAAVSLLANFLSVLMLERNEVELSKEMRSELEKALFAYHKKTRKSPSLSDFLEKSEGVPRAALLKRWSSNGVFKNAFADLDEAHEENRLRYFNFSEIFQASDPDFGQGGLAAVMALFNFEMMKNKENKIVFIADETPFFIKRCFSFFKFSTANVRKFGGSFITVAQNSSDVVVNGDEGILDNSNSKFLFSIDGRKEEFKKRLKLSSKAIETIESLEKINGKLSEVFLSDGFSEKVLRLRLSPQEYWSVTSSHSDTSKLNQLLTGIPGLTEEEAIRCLASI
jgi:energy-coupling factor transporter ATP-binding protein EcfA2